MLYFMILMILLLTLAAMLAMRRIEEGIIKQYQKDRHDQSDII